MVSNKKSHNFRAWLHTALQPIVTYRREQVTNTDYSSPPDETDIQLDWVYGCRCQDTKRCVQYTIGRPVADSVGVQGNNDRVMAEYKEEIIYFVSSVAILLNKHLNRQRFYTQHTQEIISLAVSNGTGDVVATGELSAIKPAIHIWNCRTLVNYNVLQGIHAKGVHLLAFSHDDKFLISCGLQAPSAVIIYDWVKGTIIISSSISSPTIDLVVLRGESNPNQIYQE